MVLAVAVTVISVPDVATADVLFDGNEFQVNTNSTSEQTDPAVSAAADGSFVVVWQSYGQDGPSDGVFGQRYDGAGATSGAEFRINTYTMSSQTDPAIAVAADASFVAVWQSYGQDGPSDGVFGQRYDSAGTMSGSEFRINTYTTSSQTVPAVAVAVDGSFVVVWQSYGQDGPADGIFGQRYDSTGATSGSEFRINAYTTGSQTNPAVSAAVDGSFVVVWQSYGQDGASDGVFGQRYDSTGAASGGEFRINTYTTGSQADPAVSVAADGSFVVVWQSYGQDGASYGVFAQRYDSAGAVSGGEFQVNTYTTSSQADPAVSVVADGSFVVVWQSYGQDGPSDGIFGQLYDGTGATSGSELRINTYTTRSQTDPAVSVAGDGSFVVVWQSYGQDGPSDGVFGQILCVDDNANAVCDNREPTFVCGDPTGDDVITATDALFVLRTAVGLSSCEPCVCDADGSGSIAASDALRVLTAAVGQNVELLCPPCA